MTKVVAGSMTPDEDTLVREEPIELRLDDVPVAVLMRTPGNERALALGFCLTEGILLHPDEFEDLITLDDAGRHRMVPAPSVTIDPEQFRRNTYTTSSCGVCGKASIDAVRLAARPLPPGPTLDTETVFSMPRILRSEQENFDATGAIHAAALFDGDGRLLAVAEDVGRHNAVDKVIGMVAPRQWPLGAVAMCVSGRISFEITQKAAVAGIPVVIGVSAASSLAAELASEVGMTLAGFVRGDSMVIYSHPRRFVT